MGRRTQQPSCVPSPGGLCWADWSPTMRKFYRAWSVTGLLGRWPTVFVRRLRSRAYYGHLLFVQCLDRGHRTVDNLLLPCSVSICRVGYMLDWVWLARVVRRGPRGAILICSPCVIGGEHCGMAMQDSSRCACYFDGGAPSLCTPFG